jgi:CO/xanthine dehydrogenase FAD-binding subunit
MSEAELLTPAELGDLAAALAGMTSRSRLLAGGTDLVNAMRRDECRPDLIVDLSGVRELAAVRLEDGVLRVGAMATFSQLQTDPVVRQYAACLAEAAAQVGSTQIRNIATIGGNVANASPCGDSIPALMALDARVTVLDRDGRTSSRPIRDVVVGPSATSLVPGEAITDFTFAPVRPHERSVFAKIGSRSAVTVARLSAAVVVAYDPAAGTLSAARVALGAVGDTAFRDVTVEASLEGRPADEATARRFAEACADAVCASIPGRYSLPYKRHAAVGLAYDAWNGLAVSPSCEPVWD